MDETLALSLPGAVRWPPKDLAAEPDAPFDLNAYFSPIPDHENAASDYLRALAEFEPAMADCFPEPARESVRTRAVRLREKLVQVLDPATGGMVPGASTENMEEVLKEFATGLSGVRAAQERPTCWFELGPRYTAKVPHGLAAHHFMMVARLQSDLDLRRGDIIRPIKTIAIALRLARDVQRRASLICQIVSFAGQTQALHRVLEILHRREIRTEHFDLLLDVLQEHERQALPHALAEGHRVEYVYARTALADMEYRTGDFSPEGLRMTTGYGTHFKTIGEMMIHTARSFKNIPGYRAPRQTARQIDADLERMTSEDFRHEAQYVRDYYRKLIAAAERPYQEQLANLPKPEGFYLNLPSFPMHRLTLAWARSQAGLRLALGLAAVRRRQFTEAANPPDLETAFRSAGLASVPTDPFGDGPIRMAVIDSQAVVYSVGADGRDDGGRIDWNDASQPGDFTLGLYPLLPAISANHPASLQSPRPAKPFPGAFKLFRMLGADVYLHWLWFLAAVILIRERPVLYSSFVWDVIAYVGGFGIVLLHEFGHILACRHVGGVADRVLLWPLGGLAFVAPPQRPGAQLWTTVAGPLVNVVLAPFLIGLAWLMRPTEPLSATPNVFFLCREWAVFNVVILVFNLLPIFPLDGGRIVFSVLWFVIGRANALATASVLGLLLGGAMAVYAVYAGMSALWWLLITALFICYGAVTGLRTARKLAPIDRASRRQEFTCPGCGLHPSVGAFWNCPHCRLPTDAFEPLQICSRCQTVFTAVGCLECGRQFVGAEWHAASTYSTRE